MSIGLRLDLKQSQQLVMTPQLQQAIKLLQMTNLEVTGYVEQELAENPFLEGELPNETGSDAVEAPLVAAEAETGFDAEEGWYQPDGPTACDRMASVGGGAQGGNRFDDELPDLEQRLAERRTLADHLMEQLHVDVDDPVARLIGLHLIETIDEDGYCRGDLGEIAERLAVEPRQVEAILERIQGFDPTGVGARSLQECLALQLRELNRLDPAMQMLLKHLDRLAKADRKSLLRLCQVDEADLADMIAEIRALDPRPGLRFAPPPEGGAVPDLWIYPNQGGWRVELNNATLPRVLVDVDYYTQVSGTNIDPSVKQYFAERFQAANWLVKALDQRARTVLKVAEFIVAEQTAFLRQGPQHLRPLVLRQVAEGTGLHESTVSRATAGKLVATPQGVFPFKYFFSNAVGGDAGSEAHAAEAIRQQIRTLVDRETAETVLSDDQIVKLLKGKGMVLARRTVAKYRESLGIPSSVERRRQKTWAS
ncbi:MAG: RNA polymerase sigma-54 factor [Geminicoccaceae bacterium]|nr:MAG: RNA polymerase sigma-54 factor [Geminicoccaceae bacterium]